MIGSSSSYAPPPWQNGLSNLRGEVLTGMPTRTLLHDISMACNKYEQHCRDDQKIFGKSRRANRLEQVENLRMIISALSDGAKDPKDYLASSWSRR